MLRYLLVGIWACLVALGSTYGGVLLKARRAAAAQEAPHDAKSELKKVKPITVPVISGGALKGYVSAEFSFLAEAGDTHEAGVDPESFIMDEAFRLIYSDNKLDFSRLEKLDIDALTRQIAAKVNARLGGSRIKEVLVKNLVFVPKDDLPR